MKNRNRFLQHGGATQKRRTGNAYAVVAGKYVPIQVSGTPREIEKQLRDGTKKLGVKRDAVQTDQYGDIHVGVMPIV